jgi:putative spermidine/putrescine transport system ATP-binding protein
VHLKLGSRDSIVVKVPNTQRHALPSAGSTIDIAWRHDDCKILAMMAQKSAPAIAPTTPPSPSLISTAPAGAN